MNELLQLLYLRGKDDNQLANKKQILLEHTFPSSLSAFWSVWCESLKNKKVNKIKNCEVMK